MLVHGYQQVLRLARLPAKSSLTRFAQTARERGSRSLDAITAQTQRGIAVTETVVGHAVDAAPRPSRQALEVVVERAVRSIPRLAGRPVEVVLMAATVVATLVLGFVLVSGLRSASAHLIDVVGDATGSALTQLDFDAP